VHLPFRFKSLAWWHAAVPCLILLAAAGVPAAVLALAAVLRGSLCCWS
jgi:hypothetical protein